MNQRFKSLALWIIPLVILLLVTWQVLTNGNANSIQSSNTSVTQTRNTAVSRMSYGRFIDYINAWHAPKNSQLNISDFTQTVKALHYYNSMLIIEKSLIEKPTELEKGSRMIKDNYEIPLNKRIKNWFSKQRATLSKY